jgi:hypothetical protein
VFDGMILVADYLKEKKKKKKKKKKNYVGPPLID